MRHITPDVPGRRFSDLRRCSPSDSIRRQSRLSLMAPSKWFQWTRTRYAAEPKPACRACRSAGT